MKLIALGTGLLAVGLWTMTVYEEQTELIKQREAQIEALESDLGVTEGYVSELEKNLQKTSSELKKATKQSKKLQKEKEELQSKLDKLIVVEATAYLPTCEGCSGITKTGVNVENTKYHEGKRVIAVDPAVIPLGSTVRVHTKEGSFLATAEDIGGGINGREIDILFLSEKEAENFGRQRVTVEKL